MASRLRRIAPLAACACLLLAAAVAGASGFDADANSAISASRAARLGYVEGNVRVVQDAQIVADPAIANMPLFEGGEITTANDGKAEIQFEDGSVVRLAPNSTVALSVLARQGAGLRAELVLRSGLAYFELQPSNAEHSLRVNYGDASFTAANFSVIRLTNDAPPAELAVLTGSIHLERGDVLQLDVHSGESLSLDAADASKYNLASTVAGNSWDSWNADRDQFLNSQAADRTAATGEMRDYPSDGMSDLDANGSWYNIPGQGYVWSPYDAQSGGADWDPYGYGDWVSYPQYGYVWVSGYNWGYSPYQCGLWDFYEDFGWAWAPGSGCNAWWGGGGGWGYRIGQNLPPGYRPPHRPVPIRPGKPKPRNAGPLPVSLRHALSAPVIAIDRRTDRHTGEGGASTAVARGANDAGPVMIAGHAVEPLPHLAPRQGYVNSGDGYVNRSAPPVEGFSRGTRSTYVPITPANRPGGIYVQPTPRPAPPRYEPPRSAPPPAPHYSAPPPAAPAPHPSSAPHK